MKLINAVALVALCGAALAASTCGGVENGVETVCGTVTVTVDSSGALVGKLQTGVLDESGTAWGTYARSENVTGWGELRVWTNGGKPAKHATFAAGYLEGALTQETMFYTFLNARAEFFGNGRAIPDAFHTWVRENREWTLAMAAKNDSALWKTVAAMYAQEDGLIAGYASTAPSHQALSGAQLRLLNLDGDAETISALVDSYAAQREAERQRALQLRCSALIKLAPDGSDIFFGHTTWDSYAMMIRIYKHYFYNLPDVLPAAVGGAVNVSFSSSPGFLTSVDDFYLTSTGLAVTETTNAVFNASMMATVKPQALLSWVRVAAANLLAQDGASWASLFATHNSGTYNNGWMVVDYNRFTPGKPLPAGTFTYLEQVPGLCMTEDKSSHLNSVGYWASYNVPAIPYIFNISGYQAMYEKHGDYYSHDHCPRANVFRSIQAGVKTFDDYKLVMRYNHWRKDAASMDNPTFSISARGDLMKKPIAFGGIDSKATNYARALHSMSAHAENGPTHDTQPVFSWTAQLADTVHAGQPTTFNYTFVPMCPSTTQPCP